MSGVIKPDSKVAQVAAYVGQELFHYEDVELLINFIVDQRINGSAFISLNDDDLIKCGMNKLGPRKNLLELVQRRKNSCIAKILLELIILK
jgi:hypothetical protein